MSAPFLPYTLEITTDGQPCTFKVMATNCQDAEQRCKEYYRDPILPRELHKAVKVLRSTQESWQPEGFRK